MLAKAKEEWKNIREEGQSRHDVLFEHTCSLDGTKLPCKETEYLNLKLTKQELEKKEHHVCSLDLNLGQ